MRPTVSTCRRARALAELAAERLPKNLWCRMTRSVALYRTGKFNEADRELRLASKSSAPYPYARPPGPDAGPVFAWLLLALTSQRCGQAEEARAGSTRRRRIDAENAAAAIGPAREQRHVWAMCAAPAPRGGQAVPVSPDEKHNGGVRIEIHRP